MTRSVVLGEQNSHTGQVKHRIKSDSPTLSLEDWRELRSRGIPLLLTAAGAMTARTAAECHSVLTFLGLSAIWAPALLFSGLLWFWWAGVVLLWWVLAARVSASTNAHLMVFGGHLVAAVVAARLHMLLIRLLVTKGAALWPQWSSAYSVRGCITGERFAQDLIIYALLLCGSAASFHYLKSRQAGLQKLLLERELLRVRCEALQQQMQPHFLFNALNTIQALIDLKQETEASQALSHLSRLLRLSLQAGQSEKVSVRQEITMLDSYVALQRLRFAERLDVSVDTSSETLASLVPPFLLQPLVENAIVHGISADDGGAIVRTSLRRLGDVLHVCVFNTCGMASSNFLGHGLGLRVVQERLLMLYPERHTMRITRDSALEFRVDIQLPFESTP